MCMPFRALVECRLMKLRLSAYAGHEIGEDSVQIYREVLHPNGELMYQSKHGNHEGAGPLHGQPILAPYPTLEGLQQKRLAARRHKTTYAYDFPTVFGNALRELWTARAIAGEPCAVPKGVCSATFQLAWQNFRQTGAIAPWTWCARGSTIYRSRC